MESQISASTPSSPSARNRASSVSGPIVGVGIELPVAGVDDRAEPACVMASDIGSGIEWATGMASILNGPTVNVSPAR